MTSERATAYGGVIATIEDLAECGPVARVA